MVERVGKFVRLTEVAFLVAGVSALAIWGGASLYSMFFELRAERELETLANRHAVRISSEQIGDSLGPVGGLEIPAVGLKVIVFQGTDPWTLNRAVGHIPGTAFPGDYGNVGIAGHRDTFFRVLKDVALKDQIILRTPANTYYYRVESINVVAPEDDSVLRNSSDRNLTLVACCPFYFAERAPERFIVKAHQVSVPPGF
jgi:sortase A